MSFDQIKSFEESLDREMAGREIFKMPAPSVLRDAFGAISMADSQPKMHGLANMLKRGLDVALPSLIKSTTSTREIDFKQIFEDLEFLSHYYLIREYLYYSYNSPESFSWKFDEGRISIEFADPSIPRQFSQGWNAIILDTIEMHRQGVNRVEIEQLLRSREEYGNGEHIMEAFGSTLAEAKVRARLKFDLLDAASAEISLKGYSYESFRRVYEYLLAKALYHRYYARANSTWASFQFPKDQILEELSVGTGLPDSEIRSILGDLTYSPNKKLQPMYFNIVDHPALPELLMTAESIIDDDMPAHLLRVQASRDPNWFLSRVSNTLGGQFVDRLASMFEEAGFLVQRNVQLASINSDAPDIDLLVISREETLGYLVFAIEAKATIPAYWAKDYLRALNKGGLSKAFDQVASVLETLSSEAGINLLTERVLSLDPTPLSDGHIVLRPLIVTSQNSGMFFEKESSGCTIIDYRTLGQMIKASDGDVVYIIEMLKSIHEAPLPEIAKMSVNVEGISVTYDVVAGSDPVFFPPHEWKSSGLDVQVARDFFKNGGSRQNPFG
ncbi:hypothetical protein [Streptomyces labedae]|uniref:NERD domain-containing protein n=1 Tax=Streptomyces labedae TaxID=285569 RepID=A0ABP6R2L0_9ACTN